MDDERDAKAAIDELNGTTIDGQEVKVELAKPNNRGGRGGAQGHNNQGGGGRNKNRRNDFHSNSRYIDF